LARIQDFYQSDQLGISIEIFPPKTAKGDETLFRTLDRLAPFRPAFVSCTYGAGGSVQQRTIDLCVEIQNRYALTATAHRTCVGVTREDLCDWLALACNRGIQNIMALRGDPPEGQGSFQPVPGGLAHADELVRLIREQFPELGVGVGGYPETHPEAPDPQTDLENLKRKVSSGADAVFTQLFYVNDVFLRFRERYQKAGIAVPLIPGIMPVTEFARIQRITALCGACFPDDLARRLEAAQDDRPAQFQIGVEHAVRQCRELIDQGVPGIHFYVLNRSRACERILESLGISATVTRSD